MVYLSLEFKLSIPKRDTEKLLNLMRLQSSAVRVAYNVLKRKINKHSQIYQRLKELLPDLPTRYIDSAIYKAKQYPTDKKIVFGGKSLFGKLCKKHITGKAREKIKKQWREKRQGTLISIGSKADKGNRLLRFEYIENQLYLRITVGKREFIYAKVLREPSNSKDKWISFLAILSESWKTNKYFAYTVELKLKNEKIYGNVSFEIPTPEIQLTRRHGVIAIDTNASPLHLAVAEVSPDGNILSYQRISLHKLLGMNKNQKENEEWLTAHQIVELAKEKGKAIAIENLKKLSKGRRGDGKAKLRRKLHYWNFRKLLTKIKRIAQFEGIEVVEVNPAYTSVIGMLKYAPQLNIDKDIAGAYAIGRRALGFKENIPKNYLKLLADKEYLDYALHCYKKKEEELTQTLSNETNRYKKKAVNSDLEKIKRDRSLLLESLQSEPSSCEGAK